MWVRVCVHLTARFQTLTRAFIPELQPNVLPSVCRRGAARRFGAGFDWLLTFNRKIDVMQLVLQLNRLMIVQQKQHQQQRQERCAKRALYSQQELFNGSGGLSQGAGMGCVCRM